MERPVVPRVRAFMDYRSLIERLARHLSATQPHNWQDRVEDAASILALIKEPDAAMRETGDVRIWTAMIDTALREGGTLARPGACEAGAAGSDEEGDIALTPDAISHDRADWVHLGERENKA